MSGIGLSVAFSYYLLALGKITSQVVKTSYKKIKADADEYPEMELKFVIPIPKEEDLNTKADQEDGNAQLILRKMRCS